MTLHLVSLSAAIILNGVALVLLKHLAGSVQLAPGRSPLRMASQVLSTVGDVRFLCSVACFALAAGAWIIALVEIDLTVAYPSVSVSYVFVALLSRVVFREQIALRRWVGIGFVVVGVAIMFGV